MASAKTNIRVGLFVLAGCAVVIIGSIWVGAAHYFEKGSLYEAYFDESVQGLDKDSPVKYRGVAIGRVQQIEVAPDGNLIRVVMLIESDLKNDKNDVAARLKSVGITGIMFIEMDRKGGGEADYAPKILFPTQYPVIATKASEIKKFTEGMDMVVSQLKDLNLKGVSAMFKESFGLLSQAVKDAKIKEISSDVRYSFSQLKDILRTDKWDRVMNSMDSLASSFAEFSQSSDSAIKSGERLMKSADSRFSVLQRRLMTAIRNFESATLKLNGLIEVLADQPSQVIFSRPPRKRHIERGKAQ